MGGRGHAYVIFGRCGGVDLTGHSNAYCCHQISTCDITFNLGFVVVVVAAAVVVVVVGGGGGTV